MLYAAGGEFSLVGGKWFDGYSSPEPGCKPCPSKDATIVVCEGNTVKSQAGYYAYFIEEESRRTDRYAAVAFARCPNQEACKKEGIISSPCADSLAACNSDTGGKCAEGYTGTNMHTHQACYFTTGVCRDALRTVQNWLVLRKAGVSTVDHAHITTCVHRALSSAKLVRMRLYR